MSQHDSLEHENSTSAPRFYVAQCPISSLDPVLRADLPAPELVLQAGRGDVYDSSIWLGMAPTYTPLHKDPNPNLLVQMAGTKIVRLLEPVLGLAVYEEVQRQLGSRGSATVRGEEMMQGKEKELLEASVWDNEEDGVHSEMYEGTLHPGDALFIPKGWWHSVRGSGKGVNGSVSDEVHVNGKDAELTVIRQIGGFAEAG